MARATGVSGIGLVNVPMVSKVTTRNIQTIHASMARRADNLMLSKHLIKPEMFKDI
jgi:hypothetical protein